MLRFPNAPVSDIFPKPKDAMVGSRPATPEVSHGRGGAGNIAPDETTYVDGEVVRAGPEGSHADGAFSTGRGGKQSGLVYP